MRKQKSFRHTFWGLGLIVAYLVCFWALPQNISADIKMLKERKDTQWLCDLFMLKLTELDANEAFLTLRPYSTMAEEDFAQYAEQANTIIETVKPDYGKIVGYVLLEEKSVKDIVLRYTYLLKFERHALRWTFFFYRSDSAWIFNEFNVDNKLHELFN